MTYWLLKHKPVSFNIDFISNQQFPIWGSNRVWGMLGEDVGSRGRFLLLGNCSRIALIHAILGA
jgi:hypothetical protein